MRTVAVLFARIDSIYHSLPGCDVYDIEREATPPALAEWLVELARRTQTHPQGDQPRFERGREGMEPEACESAAGRGTDGAPALATLPRYASPGGGPMGAGQPTAVGPAGDRMRATA